MDNSTTVQLVKFKNIRTMQKFLNEWFELKETHQTNDVELEISFPKKEVIVKVTNNKYNIWHPNLKSFSMN